MSKSVARLFKSFQPNHYNLTLDIDDEALKFSGRVVISGRKIGRPSQRITLHGNGLKIASAKVAYTDKKKQQHELSPSRINLHKSFQEIRLHFDQLLYPGDYTVEIEFSAPITRGMTGIYPCFFNHNGQDKKLIATQFESHHAREAFPCVDEPEAKATFDLELITRDGIELLSNNPIKSQEKSAGRLQTVFERTPKMSTYLLAFVMGEMASKTATTKSGVTVNTWATVAQPIDSLNFALDVAVKSIEYFEDYFGAPYPLPKSDHVALPDFSSGAMENWGLITYRERVMLAYPGETGQSTFESIALVIAHETSHQWFGNLVTMRWWDDLWLNESFANMMEYQCIDSFFPEWNVWDTFISAEGLSAFRRDSIAGVQAVRTDVNHPDEISSLFDPSIVYAKGGRLLYMLKNYVGETAFQQGLSAYFEKHAYGNTTGDDLWAALSEASGKDVGSFMNAWLSQSGFPLLTVDQDNAHVTISQKHFLDNPTKADDRLWTVPLFSSQIKTPDVITKSQTKLPTHSSDPVLLNAGSAGHYLVKYNTDAANQLVRQSITDKTFSSADRLMALNASSMLSKAGQSSFADSLELLSAYRDEDSEPVWDMMALVTGEARRFIDLDNSLEPKLKTLSGQLAGSQIARLGWSEKPNESTADQKLRGLVLGLGIYADDKSTTDQALKLFNDYRQSNAKLSAELRSLIMTVPIKLGDDEAFDFLLDKHDSSQNSDLKNDIADALTSTRQPERAHQLLARLKDSSLIKPQDADRWLIYLMRNRYTRDTAWQWMVDNWDWLEKTYKSDKSYDYLPRYAASVVNTAAYAEKFHDLFDSKLDQPLLKRNIEIGSEEIATRVAWLERDLPAVQKFLTTVQSAA